MMSLSYALRLFSAATFSLALAVTTAVAAPTASLSGGSTTVTLSSGFVNALSSLKVQTAGIDGGVLAGGKARFRITTGSVDLGTVKAEIAHRGGLSLTTGSTVVELSDFVITTLGSKPQLTGLVTANDSLVGRIPLFNLELPAVQPPLRPDADRRLAIPNVRTTLTKEAADALNSTFKVSAFAEGLEIGSARVALRAAAPAKPH